MKASKEFQNKTKEAITAILRRDPDIVQRYVKGDFTRSDKVQDLNRRFRFDLFWMAVDKDRSFYEDLKNEELEMTHLYTVLCSIVPTIK